MKKWQKITLIGCGTCFALAVVLVVSGFFLLRQIGKAFMAKVEDFDESKQPWVECAIPHPGNTPSLIFMQKSIHPFLAEYEYKVHFQRDEAHVDKPLPINCGGRTRMNVYLYPTNTIGGPWLRLQDQWGEYLVDLGGKKTYHLVRYREHAFAGELSSARDGWSVTQFDDGKVTVKVGENPATDITSLAPATAPGEYLGRIDGQEYPLRFAPASESPEEKIEMIK
jgi:hypothetical protein